MIQLYDRLTHPRYKYNLSYWRRDSVRERDIHMIYSGQNTYSPQISLNNCSVTISPLIDTTPHQTDQTYRTEGGRSNIQNPEYWYPLKAYMPFREVERGGEQRESVQRRDNQKRMGEEDT